MKAQKKPVVTSYEVTTDDVIIRGVNHEYYPCKKDIFHKTYDLI